jgi:dTDP-4-dehydrorhamnose 3,5-epimerase
MSNFQAKRLSIKEVFLITPQKVSDQRGYFMETYQTAAFESLGIGCEFVQDNHAYSKARGTLRGLHFQIPPCAQAKLVRVVKGSIYDVAVDLRNGSPSYGAWCAVTLTAADAGMVFIPVGFAHGYCTLEADTEVSYKVDAFYSRQCEGGLAWNDADIGIDWPLDAADIVTSEKDAKLPGLKHFSSPFS